MAKLTKVDAVVETIERVVEPERYLLELTADEKKGLQHLLGYGVNYRTIDKLNLENLFETLNKEVFGGYEDIFGPYDTLAMLK